jgi:hypothetical protein
MSSSSPDPFKTVKKEQQLRNIVHAEPSLPLAIIPLKPSIERHFSDLSLNQIENDSLVPATSSLVVHSRASFSCSSSSSSSTDDSSTAFIHIQMNNLKYDRGESIPIVFATTNIKNNNNSNSTATKSSSFIHNVSITV